MRRLSLALASTLELEVFSMWDLLNKSSSKVSNLRYYSLDGTKFKSFVTKRNEMGGLRYFDRNSIYPLPGCQKIDQPSSTARGPRKPTV